MENVIAGFAYNKCRVKAIICNIINFHVNLVTYLARYDSKISFERPFIFILKRNSQFCLFKSNFYKYTIVMYVKCMFCYF